MAPSFRDFESSTILDSATRAVTPKPSHLGHIPAGSLKPYALENPATGSAIREYSSRSRAPMSLMVPTVDRDTYGCDVLSEWRTGVLANSGLRKVIDMCAVSSFGVDGVPFARRYVGLA